MLAWLCVCMKVHIAYGPSDAIVTQYLLLIGVGEGGQQSSCRPP